MNLPDTTHPDFKPIYGKGVYVQWLKAYPDDPKAAYWKGCIAWHDRNRPIPVENPARLEFTPKGSFAKVYRATTQKICPKCEQLFTIPKAAMWQRSVCHSCQEVDRECSACGEVNRVGRYETEFICWQCEAVNDVRTRGFITRFSESSRKNLMTWLNKIRMDALPYFVTLTFPDSYIRRVKDARDWKRCLRVFEMRFKRAFPHGSAFWRLETIDRKSGRFVGEIFPHYHLLTFGVGHKKLAQFVESNWPEIACPDGQNDIDFFSCQWVHSASRNEAVKRVDSRHGVMAYASKTLALTMSVELSKKIQTLAGGVGRWWGIFNRDALESFLAPLRVDLVPDDTAKIILDAFMLRVTAGMKLALQRYRERGEMLQYERLAAKIKVMVESFFQSLIAFVNGDEVESMLAVCPLS